MRFRDPAPAGPEAILSESSDDDDSSDPAPPESLLKKATSIFTTVADSFGLFREYAEKPQSHPDQDVSLRDLTNVHDSSSRRPGHLSAGQNSASRAASLSEAVSPIWPFPSVTSLLFLRWFHNGIVYKTIGDRGTLIREVIRHPEFDPDELDDRELVNIESQLDRVQDDESCPLWTGEGWKTSTVSISVPVQKSEPVIFQVPGVHHRSITRCVVAEFQKKRSPASALHFIPFRSLWICPTPLRPDHIEEMYDEMYSSRAWLEEHERIRCQPAEILSDGSQCTLPRCIAGLLFWSDATQLAAVGAHKLWPLYLYFGNQSKYFRGKPSARECHHMAYFASVSR